MAGASPQPLFQAEGAVFDLDGTLLDTEPIYYESYAAAAAEFGKGYSFEEAHRYLLGRPEAFGAGEFLRILGINGLTPHQLLEVRDKYFLQKLPSVVCLPGAVAAVAAFAGRVPCALATSSSREYLPMKRSNNEELFKGFDKILCGTDEVMAGRPGKPSPDIFLAAAELIGVQPTKCVAFEDSIAGVQAAKAAGMFVVGIPDPRLERAEFLAAGPDVVLESLELFDPAIVGLPRA